MAPFWFCSVELVLPGRETTLLPTTVGMVLPTGPVGAEGLDSIGREEERGG